MRVLALFTTLAVSGALNAQVAAKSPSTAASAAPSIDTQPVTRKFARAPMSEAEKRVDQLVQKRWADDPLVLLGNTRAHYIDGAGVVMSIELNLVTGPTVGPFNPNISPEAVARHRQRKLARLPELKALMKDTLNTARAWFPELRDEETIVFGVSLLRYAWEDAAGLPTQIVMQTKRKAASPVREQEF